MLSGLMHNPRCVHLPGDEVLRGVRTRGLGGGCGRPPPAFLSAPELKERVMKTQQAVLTEYRNRVGL